MYLCTNSHTPILCILQVVKLRNELQALAKEHKEIIAKVENN